MSTPGTILYVDDEDANLTVFQAALESEFEVLTASGAERALEILSERQIAILVTDQRMPGTTGTQLAEIVRKQYPDTFRYLVTAYSDLDAAIDAINKGQVRRYIRKPWDIGELRAALREGIELYQVNQRVRDLERRILEVERVYSLGVVAASVAHELKNPALIVQHYIDAASEATANLKDALVDDNAGEHDIGEMFARAQESLVGAAESAQHMFDVVRGVEMTSRRRDATGSSDLREVLRTTTKMIMGDLRVLAALEMDIQPTPLVKGSPTQLTQVVLNLLINAMQALPEDGGGGQSYIRLRLRSEGDNVRLEVEDTGAGIPEDVRGRIFDPFFTTKERGGTGLGLAISKQIVEEVGGTMEFRTELGKGTCFIVTLPAAQ